MEFRRLVETAFPIQEASIDSLHEKTVRHGHIASLHLWPARRPLAACRAALVATLIPDANTTDDRNELLRRLAGKRVNGKTAGGILHWGNESNPDVTWFRERIRKAYGDCAPRILDPFGGGGAIPLEAMRLGCETTAADINPVAWFILKCTLEYPHELGDRKWALPSFVADSPELLAHFEKKRSRKRTAKNRSGQSALLSTSIPQEAQLATHLRVWGWWVQQQARRELERFYPTPDGTPPIAYFWARTVICKACRAVVPLLKTRWLSKTKNRRTLLAMEPNADRSGVCFDIENDIAPGKGSTAQKRAHDKKIGAGTMSRAGASCPCCGVIMTMDDLRREGQAGRLAVAMTAVAVDAKAGKAFRLPNAQDLSAADVPRTEIERIFEDIPFGLPDEPIPIGGSGASRAFSADGFGLRKWSDLFNSRQLLALGVLVKYTRLARAEMLKENLSKESVEALSAYLACSLDRLLDFANCNAQWKIDVPTINHSFVRFALPITWDFAEGVITGEGAGSYQLCYERIATALEFTRHLGRTLAPTVTLASATHKSGNLFDVIVTDPPYYDAIPYAGLMDFFYVWLRRTLHGLTEDYDDAFKAPLSPKWDFDKNDGELIDDSSRFDGNARTSKHVYENGMYRAFRACDESLASDGRFVIVFAHKKPDAWEALVGAIIRAGFVVDASWPIQTEQASRMRAIASAALSSSVWLVCKKRSDIAPAGWDQAVLEEMHAKITARLREFWDAGIRGPDFVWAATGPALEAYSQHPVVKKADDPGEILSVSEFLSHVRRMVVDFVVGRVLSHGAKGASAEGLDDVTTYYLLHRNDFKMGPAPAGAVILYAISCNLRDSDLTGRYELLVRTKSASAEDSEESEKSESDEDTAATGAVNDGGGSELRLKPWQQRRAARIDATTDRIVPVIDRIHRIMWLWRAGDVEKVNDYLSAHGMWQNTLFPQVLQALIELVPTGDGERSLLESISNHISSRAEHVDVHAAPMLFN